MSKSTGTISHGTCECGQAGQLFETGECAHCTINELKRLLFGVWREAEDEGCHSPFVFEVEHKYRAELRDLTTE